MPSEKFEHVNGYSEIHKKNEFQNIKNLFFSKISPFFLHSNKYWGWGAEDDDKYRRVFQFGRYHLVRPDINVARYKMITHVHEVSNKANPDRNRLLAGWRSRVEEDGYKQLSYEVKSRKLATIYENILVDIGDKPSAGR